MGFFDRFFKKEKGKAPDQMIQDAAKAGIPAVVVQQEIKQGMQLKANKAAEKQMLQQEITLLKKEEKEVEEESAELKKATRLINSGYAKLYRAQHVLYGVEKLLEARNGCSPNTKSYFGQKSFKAIAGEEQHYYSSNIKTTYFSIVELAGESMWFVGTIKKKQLIDEQLKQSILANIKDFERLYSINSYDDNIIKELSTLINTVPIHPDFSGVIGRMHVLESKLNEIMDANRGIKHILNNPIDEKTHQYVKTDRLNARNPVTQSFRNRLHTILTQVLNLVSQADSDFRKAFKLLLEIEKLDQMIFQQKARTDSAVTRILGVEKKSHPKVLAKEFARA